MTVRCFSIIPIIHHAACKLAQLNFACDKYDGLTGISFCDAVSAYAYE